MADPIAALVEWLEADGDIAAATASRIFGGGLPAEEAASMPRAAIVVRASGGASLTAGSYVRHDTQRVDVLAYGATPSEADALARMCRLRITDLRRQVIAGCLIHWADVAGGLSAGRDRDTVWPFAFHSFQIFHALEAVS
ncbi:DUF3168 domain-containing protein [Stappia sp. TSB10P1A]|uniref:DUF3168 domain-containing protein n=1 Tax=Stappia sp. TSB10P1A TaxID=2003585 RepID=UPI0016438118|nr:DUF3168 domain-containing protein [Stappia sp. TSB10P1A]